MQGRGDLAMAQLQEDLGQPGDARRRLEMADIGLDRTQSAERQARGVLAESFDQATELDGIPQRRARAMGLDVADVIGADPGALQGQANQRAMGFGTRHGVAVGLAAMVHRTAGDHPMDHVTVGLGPGQRLEQQRPHALTRYETIGADAEGPGLAISGEHTQAGELGERRRMGVGIDPTHHRHTALAGLQVQAGFVHGSQRRRARGIDGQARAAETESIGNPVGDGKERILVVVMTGLGHSDIDPDLFLRELVRRVPGILHGVPDALHELPFLGVHIGGFGQGQVEKHRVEFVQPLDETAPLAETFPAGHRLLRVRIEMLSQGPALCGNRLDTVDPRRQAIPERLQVLGLRITSGQPDDRDVLPFSEAGAVAPHCASSGHGASGADQPGDQARRRRLLEQHGGLDHHALLAQMPAQQANHHRIEPQLAELRAQVQRLGGLAQGHGQGRAHRLLGLLRRA